jgi:ribosome-binding protein aMBF1 (putative translation factor)
MILGAPQDIYGAKYAKFDFLRFDGKPMVMSSVVTPSICKAARTLLGWSQEELSKRSGVSLRSLTRFESGGDPASAKVRDKLYEAFQRGDLQFIAANSDSAELDGVGIRWRPKRPHNGIKIL